MPPKKVMKTPAKLRPSPPSLTPVKRRAPARSEEAAPAARRKILCVLTNAWTSKSEEAFRDMVREPYSSNNPLLNRKNATYKPFIDRAERTGVELFFTECSSVVETSHDAKPETSPRFSGTCVARLGLI